MCFRYSWTGRFKQGRQDLVSSLPASACVGFILEQGLFPVPSPGEGKIHFSKRSNTDSETESPWRALGHMTTPDPHTLSLCGDGVEYSHWPDWGWGGVTGIWLGVSPTQTAGTGSGGKAGFPGIRRSEGKGVDAEWDKDGCLAPVAMVLWARGLLGRTLIH